MPKVGDLAPDFEGVDARGGKFRLSSLRGRYVVLYFYPRAMTPGCTREGVRFNELIEEFRRLKAEVVGVSTDPPEANKRFAERHGFRFRIISDVDGSISRMYNVLREDRFSAQRTTFIIDPEGRIRAVLSNIRPAERHADEALKILKDLAKGESATS
ncbi:MAG: peroxiredoxin [Thermoproteota archaeon]